VKTKGARNRTLEQTQLEAIYQRKRYKEHKRLGLCVRCSRKAKIGFIYCLVCQARMKKWWMARHPLYCLECRKLIRPEERTGRSYHRRCAQKRIARMHPPTHRKAAIAYQQRHRKLGLCIKCPIKRLRVGCAGSTTARCWNGIMKELLVERWRVS